MVDEDLNMAEPESEEEPEEEETRVGMSTGVY